MRPALRARLVRRVRFALAAGDSISPWPVGLAAECCVKSGYVHRDRPGYDDAFGTPDVIWQPLVYPAAAAVAAATGRRRIVDVGSGNGAKLALLHPRFELVGIDTGANLERSRAAYPFAHWIDRDLDTDPVLGVDPSTLHETVIVCADVIEHLRRPAPLLSGFAHAVSDGAYLILSTPDRELLWGPRHSGPPPNRAHVREWSRRELATLFAAVGFEHASLQLTQSRTGSPLRNTILVVLAPDDDLLETAVREVSRVNAALVG